MKVLQLYIGGQNVDLFKDESITLTQSIKNVRDIEKVFTEFSQSFTVPASKANNKIFKHYYDFSITGGFDARTKIDASILINSIPFTNGKIQLTDVKLKRNKAYSYTLVFFGSTVSLNDVLSEDKLSSLSELDDFSFSYDEVNVRQRLTFNPANNNVIVPLITHTQRLFYDSGAHGSEGNGTGNLYYEQGTGHRHGVRWDNLKPALRLRAILNAIEDKYTTANGYPSNIVFTRDFFSQPEFDNLFMWLHRKEGQVEPDEQVKKFSTFLGFNDYQQDAYVSFNLGNGNFVLDTDYFDLWRMQLSTTSTEPYDVVILKDGQEVYREANVTGNVELNQTDYVFDDQFAQWAFKIEHSAAITFLRIEIRFGFEEFEFDPFFQIIERYDTYRTDDFFARGIFEFIITDQIPEMKITEFLGAIFKMFNLVAYAKDNGDIFVDTYDEYYKLLQTSPDYKRYDITEYTDTENTTVKPALPFREIEFSYKDTKSFLADQHGRLFDNDWAELDYSEGRGLIGGIYKVQLPFSHFKFERLIDASNESDTKIQWGYSVDSKQEPYKGDPLIFYPLRNTLDAAISIITEIDENGNFIDHQPSNININVPSNSVSLDSTVSKSNTNFLNEPNEYTRDVSFTDTLFEKYYKNFITSTFDLRNRLITVKCNLPDNILFNLELNDRVVLSNNVYRINSMKTNLLTNETTFELLPEFYFNSTLR